MRTPKTWDHTFLTIAFAMADKSKDDSTQCGAVLVDANNVEIATGFNGPPPQIVDDFVPWDKRPDKYPYILHAEENALWKGVERTGLIGLQGSRLYVTNVPCTECTLRIIRCGVREVVLPSCHLPYRMSAYHSVTPEQIVEAQCFPKVVFRTVDFIKPEQPVCDSSTPKV